MARSVLLIWVLIAGSFSFLQEAHGFEFRLRLGKQTNGFHIPQQWHGRSIVVVSPENEHVVYSIEDIYAAAKLDLDVLVGQTSGINNAYAIIDGVGADARRMVIIDGQWIYRFPSYRVILAHELGHHVCRHTLDRFNASNRWEMELEADRAGGALLRVAYADGRGSVGGDVVDLSQIISTIRLLGPGSDTHPPAEMRVQAFRQGWNDGSPCLKAGYVPVNPFPRLDPTLVERIALRYGNQTEWCFFGSTFDQLGPCQAKYAHATVRVDGNQVKITLSKSNSGSGIAVFPPDYRRIQLGSVLFEGTSDKQKIVGTFWHRASGCDPVAYEAEGNFVENNGIFLTGRIPKLDGCRLRDSYASTLHFFKALEDILR
jgi:hypothetical protein